MEASLRVHRGADSQVIYPGTGTAPRFLLLVPLYCELDNGNLARLMEGVEKAGGSAADVDFFFLVNNSPEVAAEREEAFLENQRTLEFLRKAASGAAAISLLDLSTAGFEKNMGKLRQAGLDAWRARSAAAELARTVVVHLDADVRLPAGFFARLRELYQSYPQLEALFFQRDFELRGTPPASLLFTHPHYRVKKALFDFTNLRTGLHYGLATYQLSARFSAHERAGGFPPLAKDEDSMFTKALCDKAWWAYDSEIEMITEDRTRAAGFNSARRARELAARKGRLGLRARWRRWRRLRKAAPFSAVEALRPPRPKKFYLQLGLFDALARGLNEKVRVGELSFSAAAEELRRRVEGFSGLPPLLAPNPFPREGEALPEEAEVRGTGGSVLPPVAHALSAYLLLPTLTPGADLVGMLSKHLPPSKQDALRALIAKEEARLAEETMRRRSAALDFFREGIGKPLADSPDPFLRWMGASPELFRKARSLIERRAANPEATLEKFAALFPDYLGGSAYSHDAALLRALNSFLAKEISGPEAGALEAALRSLRL